MRKNVSLLFIVLAGCLSSCGPKIYSSAKLEESKAKVKTVAILPFLVNIEFVTTPKDLQIDKIREEAIKIGYAVQKESARWFSKNAREYTVIFQGIEETNRLLEKAGLKVDNLQPQDRGELCRLLGVDALVSGDVYILHPMTDGESALAWLISGTWGIANEVTTRLFMHNNTSELLWKYEWWNKGYAGSNPERLVKGLLRDASQSFPYRRKIYESDY